MRRTSNHVRGCVYYAVQSSLSLLMVLTTGYAYGAVMIVERFEFSNPDFAQKKSLKTTKLRLRPDRRNEVVGVMTKLLANRFEN